MLRGKNLPTTLKPKELLVMSGVFGRQRPLHGKGYIAANLYKSKESHVKIEVSRRAEVMVEGQRQ